MGLSIKPTTPELCHTWPDLFVHGSSFTILSISGSSKSNMPSILSSTSQSVSIHTVFLAGQFIIVLGFLNQPFSLASVKSIIA